MVSSTCLIPVGLNSMLYELRAVGLVGSHTALLGRIDVSDNGVTWSNVDSGAAFTANRDRASTVRATYT